MVYILARKASNNINIKEQKSNDHYSEVKSSGFIKSGRVRLYDKGCQKQPHLTSLYRIVGIS